MLFVFTAMIVFFAILFWNIYRLNQMAEHEPCEVSHAKHG